MRRAWWGLMLWMAMAAAWAAPTLLFEPPALEADDLGLVVNELDPYSVAVGAYYAERRGVPADRVVRVRFEPGPSLPLAEFERVRAEVEARMPRTVQAYALAWTAPWRVECMSVTSAFALGFDRAWCSDKQCAPTRVSPIFDTAGRAFVDHGVRPAMLLAGESVEAARAMIDRGLEAEGTHPQATAYLAVTTDAARNSRAPWFEATAAALKSRFAVRVVHETRPAGHADAMFYFTGAPRIEGLDRLRLLPGSLADHLTSFGGVLQGGSQTSALAWLSAGASASYGTVVEPCSHPQKFPVPGLVMANYLSGATAIEAYWRSVAWPGEGVFVGDPLARPFAPVVRAVGTDALRVTFHSPVRGHLVLYGAPSPIGPFRPVAQHPPLVPGTVRLMLRGLDQPFYRVVLVPEDNTRTHLGTGRLSVSPGT